MLKKEFPYLRAVECLFFFVIFPLLIFQLQQRVIIIWTLWISAMVCIYVLKRRNHLSLKKEWNATAVNRKNLKEILLRFVPSALALIGLVYVLHPEKLFNMPLERTGLWLAIIFFYPVFSVAPQEVVFRSFVFHRYASVAKSNMAMLLLSSALFAWAHILFYNWISILLCFVGGLYFGRTYQKHQSLALVCIEHALYGCFVFTVGLGWYFYTGAHLGR